MDKLPKFLLPQIPEDVNSFSFMGLLSTWCPAHRKHSIKVRDEGEGKKKIFRTALCGNML